jgi:hypothetical protein
MILFWQFSTIPLKGSDTNMVLSKAKKNIINLTQESLLTYQILSKEIAIM